MPIESRLARRLTNGVRDLLFPPRCLGCDALLPPLPDGDTVLCPLCRTAWESARAEAAPLAAEAARHGHTFAVLYHSGYTTSVPARVIYHLKHVGSPRAFSFVAAALAPRVRVLLAEVPQEGGMPADFPAESPPASAVLAGLKLPSRPIFTYPPRRRRAVSEDGFDQAARLAKALAMTCDGDFAPLLRRTHRPTAAQKHLNSADRQTNAIASYILRAHTSARVQGRTVVLCDDLSTTGATLAIGTDLLIRAGAARVLRVTVGQTAASNAHTPTAQVISRN